MNLIGWGAPSMLSLMQAHPKVNIGSIDDWIAFQGAGGFGAGPYGYPLAYGITPWGQQNDLLNAQWGWEGFGQARRDNWGGL